MIIFHQATSSPCVIRHVVVDNILEQLHVAEVSVLHNAILG